MKSLYESLLTGNVHKPSAKVQPNSLEELREIIREYVSELAPHRGQKVDLNWIDISRIDSLERLFYFADYIPVIDTWKIDHVKNFKYMFASNNYITESPLPVLQEKLLDKECYMGMFNYCINLKLPPELPAKELTAYCYDGMFYSCGKLKKSPVLPATTLADHCYCNMLGLCVSLESAPELPATTLANGCYDFMFCGCKLHKAPQLPATTLAPGCYRGMFMGCKQLKYAPELPATKLAPGCYENMFRNCTSLKEPAEIPSNINLNDSTANKMYSNCLFRYS